jgi:hypothetical protein
MSDERPPSISRQEAQAQAGRESASFNPYDSDPNLTKLITPEIILGMLLPTDEDDEIVRKDKKKLENLSPYFDPVVVTSNIQHQNVGYYQSSLRLCGKLLEAELSEEDVGLANHAKVDAIITNGEIIIEGCDNGKRVKQVLERVREVRINEAPEKRSSGLGSWFRRR